MSTINLTPAEITELIDALNRGVEPSSELLPKLFPSSRESERYNFAALSRVKVPTIEYAGKRSKQAILAESNAGIGAAPLQMVRSFGAEATPSTWSNMIVQGDNLQFLKTCYKNVDPIITDQVRGKVKLIYIDPPFATKSDFGGKDGERSYTDKVATAEFIEALRERLILMRELLADDGSIYVHLDQKMSHYVKIIMDEIFGKDSFTNEIIWWYKRWTATSNKFQKMHDTIFIYKKTQGSVFNMQYQKLAASTLAVHGDTARINIINDDGSMTTQKTGEKSKGVAMHDVWEIPFVVAHSPEQTWYPTQKPEALIERIILASSNSGDVVLDVFGGSGTTASVAEKLGRRWISCDFGKHAIYTQQKRILNIAQSKTLGGGATDEDSETDEENDSVDVATKSKKKSKKESLLYGVDPKPFAVYSVGAYDYSRVMAMGTPERKDAYIQFVLGLFQLQPSESMGKQYNNEHIMAERDGDPVEIYPLWDPEYLHNIRIDESYCESIQDQLGTKSRGVYYIVCPDTVLNCSDFTLDRNGIETEFRFMKFPYKILEDWSRHTELHDQPSSAASVNDLITSTAFYFNEDISLQAEVFDDKTLHIVPGSFKTTITNAKGELFVGLDGLAMILIDVDYHTDKPFDMDATVFAKDITADGKFQVEGVHAEKMVAIIAIDKHGNESKSTIVKR